MLTGSIIGDIKYQFRYGNMVMKLIFINVSVFVFVGLFNVLATLTQSSALNDFYSVVLSKLEAYAYIPVLLRQPWSAFTYMFLHVNLFHILFNMLALYWFGEIFVLYLGDKKVLPLYIIGGLGGALFYILALNFIPFFEHMLRAPLLGASAGIFAIVFASVAINPEHEIRLILFGNIKIKFVALALLLVGIITIPYDNAGGTVAHLGGALAGYLYMKGLQSGFDPIGSIARLFKRKPAVKVGYKNSDSKAATPNRSKAEQEKVDEILDKIARSGYDSLSKEDRDFLFNYSKK
jgi:membrane associated rhomboid family serine protease